MNTVDRKNLRLTFDHATRCMTMSPFFGFVFFGSGGFGVFFLCLGVLFWFRFWFFWLVGWVFLFGLGVFSVCVK